MPKKRIEPGYRTTVTLPVWMHDAINRLSEQNRRTISAEMTVAVGEYLARLGVERREPVAATD